MNDFIHKLESLMKEYSQYKFQFHFRIWKTEFLRFFRSMTNYNISKEITSAACTMYKGKKSYSFSVDDPTFDKIHKGIEDAIGIIDSLPEDPDYVDMDDDTSIAPETKVVNNIESLPLEKKIEILSSISEEAAKREFKIFGTFITNFVKGFVLNSNGVKKEFVTSPIMLDVKAVSDNNMVTVLESFGGPDPDKFNQNEFTDSLMKKVDMACLPVVDAPAGKYEVILSPAAIGEFIGYLMHGAHAATLDQGSSFFQDQLDKKIFPETINITDEPHNENLIPSSYSGSGRTLHDLPIVTNGVFKNFMVDNYYGNKLKMDKNGNEAGNLVMGNGDKTVDEMISTVKDGLYISKLHYMNFINPKDMTVTGLTRDGTFLIKDGKIVNVINNLRYTESIGRIIGAICEIERKRHALPSSENYGTFGISTSLMPHVKVKDFNITSSTETI